MLSKLLAVFQFFLNDLFLSLAFGLFCVLCLACFAMIRYGNRSFDTAADRARKQTHVGRKIIRRKEAVSMSLYKRKRMLKRLAMVFLMLALACFAVNRNETVRGFRVLFFRWTLAGTPGDLSIILRFFAEFVSFLPYGALIRWQRVRTHWKDILLQLVLSAVVMEALQFLLMRGETALDDIAAYMLGGLLGAQLMRKSIRRHV